MSAEKSLTCGFIYPKCSFFFFLKKFITRMQPMETMARDRIPRVETRQGNLFNQNVLLSCMVLVTYQAPECSLVWLRYAKKLLTRVPPQLTQGMRKLSSRLVIPSLCRPQLLSGSNNSCQSKPLYPLSIPRSYGQP